MIFSIIAEIIGKYLDRFRKADNFKERKIAINYLHAAYGQKALVPRIDSIYKLEDCDQAQERTLTKGRRGAVLLEI